MVKMINLMVLIMGFYVIKCMFYFVLIIWLIIGVSIFDRIKVIVGFVLSVVVF